MIKLKLRLKKQNHKFSIPISQFVSWLNKHRDFKSDIRIVVHDYPILSYGDLNDCQVDMEHGIIYYSLFDIAKFMEENSNNQYKLDSYTYALFEIFDDLSLQLSKFYIVDNENISVENYINRYDQFERTMYDEKNNMLQQFIYINSSYSQHLKRGLKINADNVEPLILKEAVKLFEAFITQQIDFPVRVKIKFTHKNLINSDGYFKYPQNIFQYPSIKVSFYEYENIKKDLGTFDAVLNILRILVHEIGHYYAFVNGNWYYDSTKREEDAYRFEDKMIQRFIDEVYYDYYMNNVET
jgi:hypothetical protein